MLWIQALKKASLVDFEVLDCHMFIYIGYVNIHWETHFDILEIKDELGNTN